MGDKKIVVEWMLDSLEEMIEEMKNEIDNIRVKLDDGKQWLEAEQ